MRLVRVWVNKKTFPQVINEVMAAATGTHRKDRRIAGVNHGNCEIFILDELKHQVEKYCLQPHADLDNGYPSFDFNIPPYGITFTLHANRYPESENPLPPTAVCNVQNHAGRNDDFEVQFYKVAFN